ncbi:TonB-dependent receptor [Caulobacter sp. KR2-114]|uniref:TonB-dependent receptor n=1 Tax=Caulobacter sp. KR2-114 TaxID=3400912 RepID=UPI003BFC6125
MTRKFGRITALLTSAATLGLLAAAPAMAADAATSGDVASPAVDEVIVTATKRPEKVRQVVGAVSALSGDQLQQLGAQSLQDYIGRVPGVVFNNYQPGNSPIVIRGVSTTTYQEQGQTVTGYYINEIPLAEPGFSILIPDVDTFDLQNVQVLRGPQGTLFGSSSLGGLIDYVTNPADANGYHAAVEGGVNGTVHAQEAGYAFKGMINIPLISDKLAVRAVGLYRSDPGYIDNTATGVKGANGEVTDGGRLSIVWTPTDRTRLTWLSLYQKIAIDDGNYLVPGTLTRTTAIPEAQRGALDMHSLKLEQDVGFANFTGIAAYAHKDKYVTFDDGVYFPGYLGGTLFPSPEASRSRSEYIEARLASKPGANRFIDWIVGANYYVTRKSDLSTISTAGAADYINAHPGDFGGPNMGQVLAPDDVFYRYSTKTKGEEAAVFGEVNLHFTPQWTLTAGGRYFRTHSDDTLVQSPGTLGAAFDFRQQSTETGFAPKASLSFKPNDNLMFYGLVSKGYRFGGPNPVAPSALYNTPLTYGTDSVVNYELGARTTWLDHRLELDATVFHINWTNIQVRLFRPDGFAYVLNAGGAHNDGVEFTGLFHVTHAIDLSSNLTYLDARLSQDLPQCQGCGGLVFPKGTQLPGASKWQVTNTATVRFGGRWTPTLTLTHHYVSAAPVALESVSTQGGYNTFAARIAVPVRKDLEVSLWANNITDTRGVTAGPFADSVPAVVIVRPRTVGLTLDWRQ